MSLTLSTSLLENQDTLQGNTAQFVEIYPDRAALAADKEFVN